MKRYIAIILAAMLCLPYGVEASPVRRTGNQPSKEMIRRAVDALLVNVVDMIENGKLADAKRMLAEMEAADPENDAVKYYRGYVAVVENDARGALASFNAAYLCDSTNIHYISRLAYLCMATGRNAMAGSYYEKLLKARPYDVEALSALSDIAMDGGDYNRADSLITVVENIQGRSLYTDFTRTEILRMSGRSAEYFAAMKEYVTNGELSAVQKKEILRNMFAKSDARFNLEHISELTAIVDTCVATTPADTALAYFVAPFYAAFDMPDKAIALCDDYPEDINMNTYKLQVLMQNERYADAIPVCDRIYEMAQGNKRHLFEMLVIKGECYSRLGMIEKCIGCYEKAMAFDPDDPMLLNNYAYYMAGMGRNLSKCLKMSRKTIEKEENNPTFLDTYAYILYRMKKYSEAKVYFKKALLYGGKDHVDILEHYADTLEALGDSQTAEIYRQKAMLKRSEK